MPKSRAQLEREIAEVLADSPRIRQTIDNYGRWTSTYSNEDFDRYQSLAGILTKIDRDEGRPAPAVGYSKERYALAQKIVDSRNRYR
jgi:hypothetical protein